MKETIVILGTLDTKGAACQHLKEQIESNGLSTIVIDIGILGKPAFSPDISAEEVLGVAGKDLAELIELRDKDAGAIMMSKGAAIIASDLYAKGELQGIIAMGGKMGTVVGTKVMRMLPMGIPKVMLSTIDPSELGPYVGDADIAMFHSRLDISELNTLSTILISNAAAAIIGMVKTKFEGMMHDRKPMVAVTVFGVTMPCVVKAKETLESAGYDVLLFHATGIGGKTMEDLVSRRVFKGVLDITTSELADELIGGVLSAGPSRMEAAGRAGIPQVVVPGGLDMALFYGPETIPNKYKGRLFYKHNVTTTLMRTTKDECTRIGKIMATKLNQAMSPTVVVIPKNGISEIDAEGNPFYDPEADNALFESIKTNIAEQVEFIELDNHINDNEFAVKIANTLIEKIVETERKGDLIQNVRYASGM
jgi:uncharacterized protein (UPF0261 family)